MSDITTLRQQIEVAIRGLKEGDDPEKTLVTEEREPIENMEGGVEADSLKTTFILVIQTKHQQELLENMEM